MNEATTKDQIHKEGIQSTPHLPISDPGKKRSVPKTWGIGSTILGSIQHMKKKVIFASATREKKKVTMDKRVIW